MWLIGVLFLLSLVGVITWLLGRRWSPPKHAEDFDVDAVSAAYAFITAPLAGFSIAGAVFLANLSRVAQTTVFGDVMALFMIAFIMLMASAIMYATLRGAKMQNLPKHHGEIHSMLFIMCNLAFYLSLLISWLGLRPLLLAIELPNLANVFTWLLLFTVFAGAIRLGAWLHTLSGVGLIASVLVPVVPIAVAILYSLILGPLSFVTWPEANPVLNFAILVFAIGAIAGGVETAMITFYGQPKFHHLLRRLSRPFLVPYISIAIAALTLLWYSIAFDLG